MAVAVSGGGDSMAALIVAAAWARTAGRPLVALSVDHRLQPGSERWTAFVRQAAGRLGADFRGLAWTSPKPASGLAAAARSARHRLLAQAARDAGACVLITGHTASDARENALLGQGPMEEWSPSPVWPEGRGVFVLRPLLALSRDALRLWLAREAVTYIDDPANDDLRQPRARARRAQIEPGPLAAPAFAGDLVRRARFLPGGVWLDRGTLSRADPRAARRVLAAALTSAGGGERPARAAGVDRLLDRLRAPGPVAATLAGARLLADGEVLAVRDAAERRRTGAGPLRLRPGERAVWDGRYEVETSRAGLSLGHLRGHAARLPRDERAALARVPAGVRPGLPVVLGPDGPSCPILAHGAPAVVMTDLVAARFLGACGAITHESDLAQGAHGVSAPGVLCSTPVTE